MSTRSTKRAAAGSSEFPVWASRRKLGTCVRPTAWRSRSSHCILRVTQPRSRCIDRTSLVSREPSLKMSSGPLKNVGDLRLHRLRRSALPPKRPPNWLKLVSHFETPGTSLAFPTNGWPSSSTWLRKLDDDACSYDLPTAFGRVKGTTVPLLGSVAARSPSIFSLVSENPLAPAVSVTSPVLDLGGPKRHNCGRDDRIAKGGARPSLRGCRSSRIPPRAGGDHPEWTVGRGAHQPRGPRPVGGNN